MKNWLGLFRFLWGIVLLFPLLSLSAEDRVIVVSSATDLNQNLNLDAVAEVFKESENLKEFERTLNDPDVFLNNLDLNGDGEVDFIRVLEEEKEGGRLIILQAILGENAYTDVAYIDIVREEEGDIQIQIRGESSLYGENTYYVPQSTHLSTWPIIISLYDPFYEYYYSPFSWNYYPSWWTSYNCIRMGLYRARVVYRYPSRSFRHAHKPCIPSYSRHHHSSHQNYIHSRRPKHYSSQDRWRDSHGDSGARRREIEKNRREHPNNRLHHERLRHSQEDQIRRQREESRKRRATIQERINRIPSDRNERLGSSSRTKSDRNKVKSIYERTIARNKFKVERSDLPKRVDRPKRTTGENRRRVSPSAPSTRRDTRISVPSPRRMESPKSYQRPESRRDREPVRRSQPRRDR